MELNQARPGSFIQKLINFLPHEAFRQPRLLRLAPGRLVVCLWRTTSTAQHIGRADAAGAGLGPGLHSRSLVWDNFLMLNKVLASGPHSLTACMSQMKSDAALGPYQY